MGCKIVLALGGIAATGWFWWPLAAMIHDTFKRKGNDATDR